MRIRVHRGSHEIGGNAVEVCAASGERLILDLGRPLSAGWDDPVDLPAISGLVDPDPTLLGLLISHPHLDHYGLAGAMSTKVPVWIGREAASVLEAASFFSPVSTAIEAAGCFEHCRPIRLGPFTVTPHLNDHSAFDAYSLLVEVDGRRLFYTGDLRGHAHRSDLLGAPELLGLFHLDPLPVRNVDPKVGEARLGDGLPSGGGDRRSIEIDDQLAAGPASRPIHGHEPVEVLGRPEHGYDTSRRSAELHEAGFELRLGLERRVVVVAVGADVGAFHQQDVHVLRRISQQLLEQAGFSAVPG